LCVCTRVYKHTHTPHPNTRKNREIYKTKPLSLPLPKHSLPRKKQALTMNKLKQTPLPTPSHTRMQVLRKPVIHAHVVERLDSTNKQNAPTRLHTYIHMRVHTNAHAHIYIEIQSYIHTHIHMYPYTHTCIHTYTRMHMHTHAQTEKLSNNASTCQAIS